MRPDKKLTAQFNKFIGREVQCTPATSERRSTYDAADPVLSELREAAKKAGFSVRVWLPDSFGTMDYRTNRLNVSIHQEADGKYRIQDDFRIG